MKLIEIYEDSQGKDKIDKIVFPSVEVGKDKISKQIVWVKNISEYPLSNLEFIPKNPNVKVVSSPIALEPDQLKILKLIWKPSLNLKKRLETTLEIRGKLIY